MSLEKSNKAKIKNDLEEGRDALALVEAGLKSMLMAEKLDETLVLAMINKSRGSKERLSDTALNLSI